MGGLLRMLETLIGNLFENLRGARPHGQETHPNPAPPPAAGAAPPDGSSPGPMAPSQHGLGGSWDTAHYGGSGYTYHFPPAYGGGYEGGFSHQQAPGYGGGSGSGAPDQPGHDPVSTDPGEVVLPSAVGPIQLPGTTVVGGQPDPPPPVFTGSPGTPPSLTDQHPQSPPTPPHQSPHPAPHPPPHEPPPPDPHNPTGNVSNPGGMDPFAPGSDGTYFGSAEQADPFHDFHGGGSGPAPYPGHQIMKPQGEGPGDDEAYPHDHSH